MRDGNAYDEFIAYLQQKVETVSVQNVLVQKHHILPFHDGCCGSTQLVRLCRLAHLKLSVISGIFLIKMFQKVSHIQVG